MRLKVGSVLEQTIRLAILSGSPVMLIGRTGIGKSEILHQFATGAGLEVLYLDLSVLEPPDLVGLPRVQDGRTYFAPPACLPTAGRGIIFFDEMNRAPLQMLNPCLQFLTLRRLHQYVLPPGWYFAAACNPDDGEYEVSGLDPAMLARFIKINVEPDVEAWLKFAETKNTHPAVLQMVRNTPGIFDATESNPRAWSRISSLVHTYDRGEYPIDALLVAVAGSVGDTLTNTFRSILTGSKATKIPDIETILNSYADVRPIVTDWSASGNTAQLESLILQVRRYLQNPGREEKVRANVAVSKNLIQLFTDVPAEYRKQLLDSHPWLGGKK